MRDHLAYKLKADGKKKPVIEGKAGQDFYKETGRWRDRDFQIDREGNRIRETITDQQTGETVRSYDEALDQHTERGSATEKRRK